MVGQVLLKWGAPTKTCFQRGKSDLRDNIDIVVKQAARIYLKAHFTGVTQVINPGDLPF